MVVAASSHNFRLPRTKVITHHTTPQVNVAKLAHLPPEVLALATQKSREFEDFMAASGADGAVDGRLALGAEVLALLVEAARGGEAAGDALVAKARELWMRANT